MPTTRRLAAILFTDIVGSTAIMQNDELTAISLNKRYVTVLKQYVLSRGGEILNDYGDGNLCCFSSITEAMRCAIEIQKELQTEPKVPLRIGLHVGEIFFDEGKVLGDGVNIASRVQSLGVANSIFFSSEVHSKIKNQQEFKSVYLGRFEFKNINEPMEIFALANEGLVIPKKEEISGKLKDIQKVSARKILFIIAGLFLLLAAVFFIYQKNFKAAGFSGSDKTVAVLPFENSGLKDSNVYIWDGITQEIINKLSKISSLQKVIAWFSVRNYKNTTKSVRKIADELGVAAILTGTIERQAGNIHISAELIDVSNDKRLWGEEYNFKDNDLSSIQSNVAAKIVTALNATLTPEERKTLSKKYTENVEAYKLYLIGRSFWNIRDPASIDSAEVYYTQAHLLDSNYALAYAGLSTCYSAYKKGLSRSASKDIALYYANKALSIDSNLSEALTSIGFIETIYEYNWASAKRNLKKAIDRDPNNPAAHIFYGNVLQYTGDTQGGLSEAKKAVELDPQSFTFNWILGRNYYFAGEYDLAIQQLQRALPFTDGQHNMDIINWSLGLVYLEKKLYPQAENFFDKLSITKDFNLDDNQIMQSYAYAIMGNKTKAYELLKKTLNERSHQPPYRIAQVYIALNDFNEAMTQLELGYEIRDTHMFWIKADPAFNPIRNEPRYRALLKKMNLD